MRRLLPLLLALLALAAPAHADVSWVAGRTCVSTSTVANNKEVSCAPPTGTQADDVVVACLWTMVQENTQDIVHTPTGHTWNEIGQGQIDTGVRYLRLGAHYRIANATDDDPSSDTYVWDSDIAGDAANHAFLVMVGSFRGGWTTPPSLDPAFSSGHLDVADTIRINPDQPDITTVYPGSMVGACFGASVSSISAIGAPSEMTLRLQNVQANRNTAMATMAAASAGAQSIGAWTNTGDLTGNPRAGVITFSIRAAGTGGPDLTLWRRIRD